MSTPTRFVCAVDFGTTFTSVAFAHSATPNEVKLVHEWPNGQTGSSAEQVPTELLYLPLHNALRGTQRPQQKKWGYEIASRETPLRWFKLLLQENGANVSPGWSPENFMSILRISGGDGRSARSRSSSPQRARGYSSFPGPGHFEEFTSPDTTPASRTADQLDRLGIEPVQAVTDFLEEVRKLSLDVMIRTYGAQFVKTSDIEYVLTVPAIWSDAAKDYMIRAATKAGYGKHRANFNLVSEPEAAAAYTLQSLSHRLKKDDTFVVCDAGGGTVDLISYKITGLTPSLSISESVSGTGDLCGSVFLNERFEAYIRRLLGDETINSMSTRSKEAMMRTWEEGVKFKFGNKGARDFELSVHGVPDDEDKNVEDGFHIMTTNDVKAIFEPVVNRILELVRQQVERVQANGGTVAAIILVGGFGCSEYLHQRLMALRFNEAFIEVLQPPKPRTAIARGALLRGLDGSIVKEQRARRHYCVTASCVYEPGKGEAYDDHRFWQNSTDEWRVEKHLSYFIRKGKVVDDTFSKPIGFHQVVPLKYFDMAINYPTTEKLLACDIDEAPEFKWMNSKAVYSVCTVQVDLKKLPKQKLRIHTNKAGKKFYWISYQLKLSVQAEVTTFEMLFMGESYGLAITRFQ